MPRQWTMLPGIPQYGLGAHRIRATARATLSGGRARGAPGGRPGLQTNEARPGVIRRRGQHPPRANVVALDAQKSDYGGSPALESWECRLRRQEDPCRTVRRAQPIGNQSFHAGAPGGRRGCVGCSFGADHMGCLVHLEHDYYVSFTPDELAKGEVYYNYRMTDGGMEA